MRLSTIALVAISATALTLATPAAAQQPPPAGLPLGSPPAAGPADLPPGGAPGGPGGPAGPAGPANAGPGGPPGGAPISSGLTIDQVQATPQPESAGRGAPDPVFGPPVGPVVSTAQRAAFGRETYSAKDGAIPEGITPLERDIFSTTDFYLDRDLWTDPRYYRCASGNALEETWGAIGPPHTGEDFPRTVAWGHCNLDTSIDQIQSPYPYETAQAHYETLMAEAKSRGGPTTYSQDNPPPDWSGAYLQNGFRSGQGLGGAWLGGRPMQIPTYLKLLTPLYQQRFVQQMYHYGQNHFVWPGAYCWPEGFMRWWFDPQKYYVVSPKAVFVLGHLSSTLLSQINIDRDFDMSGSVPNLLGDNRQWYGDTIGFWDGDALITWTSNIKGWLAHGWFEWSDEMQAVDIYTPLNRKDNGAFIGLHHETVLYDKEALAKPVRIVQNMERQFELNANKPFDLRECNQTYFPIGGNQTPVNPGDKIEFTVPDLTGRPWADIWTEYFEQGMQAPPDPNDPLAGFQ